MKRKHREIQYVEVSGRLVPADTTSPRQRFLEIGAVVALAVGIAAVMPFIARALL